MALGGTIDYFRDTVFNYPTIAECYKVAAFDGINKLSVDEIAQQPDCKRVNGEQRTPMQVNEPEALVTARD